MPATAARTLVVDAAGLADANVVKLGPTGSGTAQTARDIGASVLLSTGTGAGQLNFASGVVNANVIKVAGTDQTARDIGASVLLSSGVGAGQLNFASGVVNANVIKVAGTDQTAGDLKASLNTIDDFLDTEVAAILSDTNAILIDTAEIGAAGAGLTALATQASVTTIDDFLDTEIAAIKAKTDNLPTDPADASDVAAGLAALNDVSTAEVNAEVVDALATDTYAEPTGVPGATVALSAKVGFMYMALRNGLTVTSTKKQFLDDGGAAEWEKDLSDDGTTYTESEGNVP